MKKLFLVPVLLAIFYFMFSNDSKVREIFNSNMGFDDLSRTIEVSISQNPAAAMVFGMDTQQATEVFNLQTVEE